MNDEQLEELRRQEKQLGEICDRALREHELSRCEVAPERTAATRNWIKVCNAIKEEEKRRVTEAEVRAALAAEEESPTGACPHADGDGTAWRSQGQSENGTVFKCRLCGEVALA